MANSGVVMEQQLNQMNEDLEKNKGSRLLKVSELTAVESKIKLLKDTAPSEAADDSTDAASRGRQGRDKSRDRAAETHKKNLQEAEDMKEAINFSINELDEKRQVLEPLFANIRVMMESLNTGLAHYKATKEKQEEFADGE